MLVPNEACEEADVDARRPGGRVGLAAESRHRLLVLLGLGAALRLAIDFGTDGNPFDLQTVIVGLKGQLDRAPLDIYAQRYGPFPAWIYPPAYFAWAWPIGELAERTGLDHGALVRLLGGACDLGIAWAVQAHLGWRGRSDRDRLLAAAAVALGPVFIAGSSVHGQIDTVALLPAVVAVAAWERSRGAPGTTSPGALLGLATAVKQVPGVTLLALLPTATPRERVRLAVLTGLVPALLTLPFLLARPAETVESLRYKGYPGAGGLSILLQPSLARRWLSTGFPADMESTWSGLTEATQAIAPFVLVASLGIAAWHLLRHRASPVLAACLLFLVVWVFGFNAFVTYAVWGLPFFLMAGAVRTVVAFQALFLVPLAIVYRPIVVDAGPASAALVDWAYTPSMVAAWVAACVGLVVVVRQIGAGAGQSENGPGQIPGGGAGATG